MNRGHRQAVRRRGASANSASKSLTVAPRPGASVGEHAREQRRPGPPRVALEQVRHRERIGQPRTSTSLKGPLESASCPARRPDPASSSGPTSPGSRRRPATSSAGQHDAVARMPGLARERARAGDLDRRIGRAADQLPELGRPSDDSAPHPSPHASTAAIHSPRRSRRAMSYGVDTAVHRVQSARRLIRPPIRPSHDPASRSWPASDDAVLAGRQPPSRDPRPNAALANDPCILPRMARVQCESHPVVVDASLGRLVAPSATTLAPPRHAGGAPTLADGRKKRLQPAGTASGFDPLK